jgi:hypothetical protein
MPQSGLVSSFSVGGICCGELSAYMPKYDRPDWNEHVQLDITLSGYLLRDL